MSPDLRREATAYKIYHLVLLNPRPSRGDSWLRSTAPFREASVPRHPWTAPLPCPAALGTEFSTWAVPSLSCLMFSPHFTRPLSPTTVSCESNCLHPSALSLFFPAPLGLWDFCCGKSLQVHPHPEQPCCRSHPSQGARTEAKTWSVPHLSPGLRKGTQKRNKQSWSLGTLIPEDDIHLAAGVGKAEVTRSCCHGLSSLEIGLYWGRAPARAGVGRGRSCHASRRGQGALGLGVSHQPVTGCRVRVALGKEQPSL